MEKYKIIKNVKTLDQVNGFFEEEKVRSFVNTELAITNLKNKVSVTSTGFITSSKTVRYIKHLQSKITDERTLMLYRKHAYKLLIDDSMSLIPIAFKNKTVVVDYGDFKKRIEEENIEYPIQDDYFEYLWNIL